MNVSRLLRQSGKVLTDNSPVILTSLGVVGTIATAYFTGKATFQASQMVFDERETQLIPPHFKTNPRWFVENTWKLYIPAAVCATGTIACIVLANRIGARRTAAMVAALAISERTYDEYKSKIVEKIGERKERAARSEIAQDRITHNPPPEELVYSVGERSVLTCDLVTGRYFICDMETLRRAQNDINHQVIHSFYASLSDFYNLIGLSPTSFSDHVGWNTDKMLELHFDTTLTPSGAPCLTFDFTFVPTSGYCRVQ